ncbi:hypothetical protein [Flavobacterium sp. Arc2]|jgi:hypothetical protein|uniref:hypothetical protein n=1 Tax=Flavobacterium sp. Arc2 TaxID=3046685 RepID=UPI00352DACBA
MIKKTHLLYIALTFGIAFSAIFFIIKSNDHKECEIVTKKSLDENGREVIKNNRTCL